MEIKPTKVTTTIKHKQTGEIYKTEDEWKAKGIMEKDIRRDVHVLMPPLDLFSKTKQVQNLGNIMTKPHRQAYGLGSFIKKIGRGAKKVFKSPLGKAALIGGGLWGLNKFGIGSGGIGKDWWSKGMGLLRGAPAVAGNVRQAGQPGKLGLWGLMKKYPGQSALLGLGAAGMAAPFFAKGDEQEEESPWDVTPSSIANIRNMARLQDPSLAFLPKPEYTQPGFYAAGGGIARLANGAIPPPAA